MLLSIALIFTIGLVLGELFAKAKLPHFIGMILTGILLGPNLLNLIDDSILSISTDLRTIALTVILLRAGLSLDIADLKKIGRPAFLMAFIPATLEIIAVVLLAPIFFDISYLEAAILGTVLAAVSPAVIVPKMIYLMEHKYGEDKRIPHLIMASASVDDIYVIVLFSAFIHMFQTGEVAFGAMLLVPIAILVGIAVGILIGLVLSTFFRFFRVRDTIKVMIILGVALFLYVFEESINTILPFSALLSIMVIGITFLNQSKQRALRLRQKFSKVWVLAELLLFVLVGAAVDVTIALDAGLVALALLFIQLSFRSVGVGLCLIGTELNRNERLFTGLAYLPKATVQAAIGGLPLLYGVPSGEIILAIAVLSIVVTAPIGAIGIDITHKRLLQKG